jgi:flagellar biosynthesis/type III secretory pathway chaperone
MNIIEELENVLADECTALLSGDYDQLEPLLERKSKLEARLLENAPDLSEDVCVRLSKRAAHNEMLLNSARRGIQAAMSQIKEISTGKSHSTYTSDGERAPLARPVSVTQKY